VVVLPTEHAVKIACARKEVIAHDPGVVNAGTSARGLRQPQGQDAPARRIYVGSAAVLGLSQNLYSSADLARNIQLEQ
jgi:hypothetical protein